MPGLAVLALDRAAPDLASLPATTTPPTTTRHRARRRRGPPPPSPAASPVAGTAPPARSPHDATPCSAGTLAAAAEHLVAARALTAPTLDATLDAWCELVAAELAVARGEPALAAHRWCLAEAAARAGGDPATFLAIWWVHALRALRRGLGGDGALVASWMERWLGEVAPRSRELLRCYAAAFALDDERPGAAIALGAPLVAAAPGSLTAALASGVISQAFLSRRRAGDAARVAVSALDRCPETAPRVRARLLHDAATALAAAGVEAEATRCLEAARALDPRVDADATPAELAGFGVELLLL
ncbi:MAG: hypothetical protein HS111_20415 [Kofleriaceae bacterium]|nr:hypothetical protein [Kofleriaceae bacterium]